MPGPENAKEFNGLDSIPVTWLTCKTSKQAESLRDAAMYTPDLRNTIYAADAVSHSSQLVAAYRGLESEEEDALYRDPLAVDLAGEAAMQDARNTSQAWQHDGDAASGGKRRKYQYSMMACRTKFCDNCICEFLNAPGGPKQVVLLGAGMDTRAWRLPMPKGVSWYEVDMPDVLRAKQKALSSLGAEMPAPEDGSGDQSASPGPTSSQQYRYPLRPSSWKCFPANLEGDTWQAELSAHGFKPGSATMWILEGLLMYLEPKSVDKLLTGTSGLSGQGSALVTMAFHEEVLKRPEMLVQDWGGGTHALAQVAKTFKSGVPDDPRPWFEERGWKTTQVLGSTDLAHLVTDPSSQYGFDMTNTGMEARRRMFITAVPHKR